MNPDLQRRGELPATAVSALWQGRKIEAIKILREEWKTDLKEAKDTIDEYIKTQPALEKQLAAARAEIKRSGLLWVLLIVSLLVGAYFLLGATPR